MTLDFVDIVLIIGAAQGILLAVLIFHKYNRPFANRFLGLVMALFGFLLSTMFFGELGIMDHIPHAQVFILGFSFVGFPCLYFYARFLMHPNYSLNRLDSVHFLPFVAYHLCMIPRYIQSPVSLNEILQRVYSEGLSWEDYAFYGILIFQGICYSIWILRMQRKYLNRIRRLFSTIDQARLKWLRNITLMIMFVLIIFLFEILCFAMGVNFSGYFNLTSFLFALSVYLTGYLGLVKSEVLTGVVESVRRQPMPFRDPSTKTSESKYGKSGLTPETAQKHLSSLLHLMETETPYTNSELTLTQLAERLAISVHNLSEILNTQLHQNFFDFINGYRLEKVKADLTDPAKNNLKILAIAYDAGFKSKTTFNTLFKKHLNLTPSEYRVRNSDD